MGRTNRGHRLGDFLRVCGLFLFIHDFQGGTHMADEIVRLRVSVTGAESALAVDILKGTVDVTVPFLC